jgi:putative transcriptional regulator
LKVRRYRSKIAETVHKTARDLYESGVMSKRTMREFDESCLTPMKAFAAKDIARLRKREEASQAVFANHLGVSVGLISQWERGEKKPQGASLKLLTLVEKNGLDWVA